MSAVPAPTRPYARGANSHPLRFAVGVKHRTMLLFSFRLRTMQCSAHEQPPS